MAIYWLLSLGGIFLFNVNNWFYWPVFPILWAAGRSENASQVYFLSFFVGILADLTLGRTLGLSAIGLMVLSLLVFLYRLRGRVPIAFMAVYTIIASLILKIL